MIKFGIIGGSGLDDNLGLKNVSTYKTHTPYGAPSDFLKTGLLDGLEVTVIARHGARHSIMPTLVNYRANLWALREVGVTHVIATTACGSLREQIQPGHFIMIDQFIDRTTKRAQTFYEGTEVSHLHMSEPFCSHIREALSAAATELEIPFHPKGTMVTIEGPRFSTRAESRMFRQWGGDVINMSSVPEVVLAREAGLCYGALAMCSDYDSWHESLEAVTVEMVMTTMAKNVERVHRLLPNALRKITKEDCACRTAFKQALI